MTHGYSTLAVATKDRIFLHKTDQNGRINSKNDHACKLYMQLIFSRERLERDQTALPAAGRVSRAQTLLPHDVILLRRAKLRVISHVLECLNGKIKDRYFL